MPWALFSVVLCLYPWLGVLLVPVGGAADVCFLSPAGVRGDAGAEGAVGDILCWGRDGVGGGVVGDKSWLPSFQVTWLAGVVWMVLLGLASPVVSTVRASRVILGGWRFLWWSDGEVVVGVGAGWGLRLGGRRFWA